MTIFKRKSLLKSLTILTVTGAILLSGCTAKVNNDSGDADKNKPAVQEDVQEKTMADFEKLLESNPKIDSIIEFIDENISNVSKENASIMVTKLEEVQKAELPALDEKYLTIEFIQSEIDKVYRSELGLSNLEEIQNEELKTLLMETRDTGYKVETAEGTYFPIISYEYLKKYSTYVTEDIKDYIDIMAVESNNIPAKDAGFVIGWDEILRRALAQEKFINNHKSSVKADEIEQLQKKYITFILYGINNTPLYSYDTKVMVPEAQTAYLNALKSKDDSSVMKMLQEYIDILEKTDYKFSDQAENFRKNAVENYNIKN